MEDRNSEIMLARSAAPESISRDVEVQVLGRHGYETAIQGKNGFTCIVQRSWTAPIDDPDFWNPKLRAPICFNAAAARSYLPRIIKKTDLILAGRTKAQMIEAIVAAIDKKELPAMEPGAMCYMLSKQGYLSDRDGHWHPHLMFFYSRTDPAAWGADLPGSPIVAFNDRWEHLTTFLIPVRQWQTERLTAKSVQDSVSSGTMGRMKDSAAPSAGPAATRLRLAAEASNSLGIRQPPSKVTQTAYRTVTAAIS